MAVAAAAGVEVAVTAVVDDHEPECKIVVAAVVAAEADKMSNKAAVVAAVAVVEHVLEVKRTVDNLPC